MASVFLAPQQASQPCSLVREEPERSQSSRCRSMASSPADQAVAAEPAPEQEERAGTGASHSSLALAAERASRETQP